MEDHRNVCPGCGRPARGIYLRGRYALLTDPYELWVGGALAISFTEAEGLLFEELIRHEICAQERLRALIKQGQSRSALSVQISHIRDKLEDAVGDAIGIWNEHGQSYGLTFKSEPGAAPSTQFGPPLTNNFDHLDGLHGLSARATCRLSATEEQ